MTDTTQDNSAIHVTGDTSSAENAMHAVNPAAQAASEQQEQSQEPQHSDQVSEPGQQPSHGRGRRRPNSSGGQNGEQSRSQNNNQAADQRQPHALKRQASPALERLFELYPGLFGAQFLPLKLGVYQELLARHPDDFKRDELKLAMGQHARSTRYLECVADGHPRHDLDGQPVEAVSPEHVHHAIIELFRRRQARSREDLRPKLTLRLIRAIEASGLSREDYMDRVRVQNESQNALLDDAFAELGMQAARREALVRTFEASGHSVAEFASMYGMNPAEVSRVLAMMRPAPQVAEATTETTKQPIADSVAETPHTDSKQ
jgi:sRNA-binding protein